MVVLLAAAAFGSSLPDDIHEAGSHYQRDSQTNEPVARHQLIKDLHRIRAKARAKHESDMISLIDSQIKNLEKREVPETKPLEETPWSDLLLRRFPYAIPVHGKPGFVFSPFANDKGYKGYIDVRGFPPGTQLIDPYTGKSFLVR